MVIARARNRTNELRNVLSPMLDRFYPLTPDCDIGYSACRARSHRCYSRRPCSDPSWTTTTRQRNVSSRRNYPLRHCRTLYYVCFCTSSDGYQASLLWLCERTIRRVRQRARCQQEVSPTISIRGLNPDWYALLDSPTCIDVVDQS